MPSGRYAWPTVSSFQHVQVCIDPSLISGAGGLEDSLLLQKIGELGASHKIHPQPLPCSVTWKRAVVEHSVGVGLQVREKLSCTVISCFLAYLCLCNVVLPLVRFPFFFSILKIRMLCTNGGNRNPSAAATRHGKLLDFYGETYRKNIS